MDTGTESGRTGAESKHLTSTESYENKSELNEFWSRFCAAMGSHNTWPLESCDGQSGIDRLCVYIQRCSQGLEGMEKTLIFVFICVRWYTAPK